jgi:hypothetical protein
MKASVCRAGGRKSVRVPGAQGWIQSEPTGGIAADRLPRTARNRAHDHQTISRVALRPHLSFQRRDGNELAYGPRINTIRRCAVEPFAGGTDPREFNHETGSVRLDTTPHHE